MSADRDPVDLDALTLEQIDDLSFGVVQVDSRGLVTFYSAAESRFSGRRRDDVLGRNFFRDVAPCTNVPLFHGRFLEGVRSGRLDEQLDFTFGFWPRPVRVNVRMRNASAPGRFWVEVRPVEWLNIERRADAVQAVSLRARAEELDVSVCAEEPIHIPGAVQPHALLIVVDAASGRVSACSDNGDAVLGRPASEMIGQDLADVLPSDIAARINTALRSGGLDPFAPLHLSFSLTRPFEVSAHLRDGRILVEVEPAPERAEDFDAPDRLVLGRAIRGLRAARSLDEVAAAAAQSAREITGFERVLVYRFDRDWNGEAVGESRDEQAYDTLLGLKFPSSDIPAQARELYLRAPPRFVIDRDYVPVPLLADPAEGNTALDMSFVQARSLSPVHLEYQRNLGVNGSMSSSILVDGRLWGLVIGHHRRPRYLAPETRSLVANLTEVLGLRIGELERAAAWRVQEHRLAVETALLQQMAATDDFTEALLSGPATLLDLFESGGAAIVDDGHVRVAGRCPPDHDLLQLSAWLREHASEGMVFRTEQLAQAFPPADAYPETASGLLAAFTSPEANRLLLWFRPEVVGTVAWGGDPRKAVNLSPGAAVLPRRSFERWVEEHRGSSTRWEDWQADAAERIAQAVESVALRQNQRIEALNAKQEELVDALLAKDVLTREIDHRVKNSLTIVVSFLQMQARTVTDPQARAAFEETYARVMTVARIHDSLYQSDDLQEVDIGQTIERLCQDLADMTGASRPVQVHAAADIKMPYRRAVGLALIVTELVTNALKYAYRPDEAGSVDVTVRPDETDGRVCLVVADHGRGLPADFSERPRQTGLGMKLVRAMLSQIEGEMRVNPGPGASFTVCA